MGYDLYLDRSGVCVADVNSWIAMKVLAGVYVFIASLPLEILSYLT